jgi:comEA protein|tara:strand:+ start:55 stop:483 length:429 start_codon:yes stop_codon:yes gene_type:complete
MTLFTQHEKQVIIFLISTLVIGYGIKLYKQQTLYDEYQPITLAEKDAFKNAADLAYGDNEKKSKDSPGTPTEKDYQPRTEIININTAEKQDLIKLPKIGVVTAERIIRFRDDFGPFNSADDLLKVKGIGPKTLEKLKPQISL